jgi:hypothetical protein
VPEVAEVVTSTLQDEEPQTPITLVTTEALASLHNLIKQDTSGPYNQSTQRIQRHVQKLASAAKISFAECALLREQNYGSFCPKSTRKPKFANQPDH